MDFLALRKHFLAMTTPCNQRLQLRVPCHHLAAVRPCEHTVQSQRRSICRAIKSSPKPLPIIPQPQRHWNALSLALLGDAVWEMHVRQFYMFPPEGSKRLREKVKADVMAETQAKCLQRLRDNNVLSDKETDVLRWALNARWSKPKRFAAGNIPMLIYKEASALEALVGHLHLSDPDRLQQIMDFLGLGVPDIGSLALDSDCTWQEADTDQEQLTDADESEV